MANLQAPDVPDVVALLDFLNSQGGRGKITRLELEPTLICKMEQANKTEARADLTELIFGI